MNRSDNAVVAVGLSGGVDSSVALYLLKQKYSRIVGGSHDICTDSLTCNDETLGRARELAERMGIPYYRFDLVTEFSQSVIQDFADEYHNGRTPNPCVRCNERIRFSLFFERCREQLMQDGLLTESDTYLFATGHYARISEFDGHLVIRKGRDLKKDQSYMLYRIPKTYLASIRFPLGDYTKEEIVDIAKREGFPSSSIKESQDICFIPGKYTDKLIELFGEEEVNHQGDIVDDSGMVLGHHRGYMHYTIGQRQGLGLGDGPWYVKRLEAERNRVVVGRREELLDRRFTIRDLNWFLPIERIRRLSHSSDGEGITVKVRYNSPEKMCRLDTLSGDVIVELTEPSAITPGQSAVIYYGEYVLGGGIIDTVIESSI